MTELKQTIEHFWTKRDALSPANASPDLLAALETCLTQMESGELRVCNKFFDGHINNSFDYRSCSKIAFLLDLIRNH